MHKVIPITLAITLLASCAPTPRPEADEVKKNFHNFLDAYFEERLQLFPLEATQSKIGQLKILELRKKAEQALGEKFNIALFHDEVLKYGSLPLDILEIVINTWIEEQK